jgi:hypothetical protein
MLILKDNFTGYDTVKKLLLNEIDAISTAEEYNELYIKTKENK